jgi:hypothetical protein
MINRYGTQRNYFTTTNYSSIHNTYPAGCLKCLGDYLLLVVYLNVYLTRQVSYETNSYLQ